MLQGPGGLQHRQCNVWHYPAKAKASRSQCALPAQPAMADVCTHGGAPHNGSPRAHEDSGRSGSIRHSD